MEPSTAVAVAYHVTPIWAWVIVYCVTALFVFLGVDRLYTERLRKVELDIQTEKTKAKVAEETTRAASYAVGDRHMMDTRLQRLEHQMAGFRPTATHVESTDPTP